MPTKKRRVGFIPRSVVLDLINKLSFESNLSISKIINILVEEALHKRGLFNIKTGNLTNNTNDSKYTKKTKEINNINNEFSKDFNNKFIEDKSLYLREENEEFIDKEIYAKFLMFLQFQEKMKG
tara:strand:+ start:120 stop:491 length:372 start_codon:yes stop_codon:yes gene_type:complete